MTGQTPPRRSGVCCLAAAGLKIPTIPLPRPTAPTWGSHAPPRPRRPRGPRRDAKTHGRVQHDGHRDQSVLEPFIATSLAAPACVRTDAAKSYNGLTDQGFTHEPVNMSKLSKAKLALHDPPGAVHLVFSHLERWLLGTHHGGQSSKHLQRHLDEFVFRFNRRTAVSIAHRFARLVDLGVATQHTPYWRIVARKAPNLRLVET